MSGEEYTNGPEPVVIQGLTDRVFTPPKEKVDLNVIVAAGPGNKISLTAHGEVDGNAVPVSGVVWNPHEKNSAAMGDFGDDQYVDMICVEPGLLSNVPSLDAGKTATFTQVMTTVDN